MSTTPRILLVQARTADDPMCDHEIEAFARQSGLPRAAFRTYNVAVAPPGAFDLTDIDAVMIGGSGAFSLVDGGFAWKDDFVRLVAGLVERDVPTFASCFGFQALVLATGGELGREPERAELGTFEVTLTDAGRADPLFGRLPERFDAQFGHNDSATRLPDALEHLARTERCIYQAVRVRGTRVIATQFHPELDMDGNLDRFRNYLVHYARPGEDFEQSMAYARSIHRPSPHSSRLLHLFVESVTAPNPAIVL